jgi:hypothetical protein
MEKQIYYFVLPWLVLFERTVHGVVLYISCFLKTIRADPDWFSHLKIYLIILLNIFLLFTPTSRERGKHNFLVAKRLRQSTNLVLVEINII